MSAKPLFIPLNTRFFDQFLAGEMRSELRRYGPRWNEKTCPVGRAVILSCGYGKSRRMSGQIREFYRRRADTFGSTYQKAIQECYGTLDLWIAEIRIDICDR